MILINNNILVYKRINLIDVLINQKVMKVLLVKVYKDY